MQSLEPGSAEYSLKAYGDMIADAVRMGAYRDALAAAIKPGAVVLDIGAGTGIMSLLACRLGAAQVYAVEPSDAIAVGIELARANDCADRIEFVQGPSTALRLKRKADVMVSDLRGVLPLHGLHIPSIVDARKRLLSRGGVQIPQLDRLHAQLVTDAPLYAQFTDPWAAGALGLDLTPALRWTTHQWRKADLSRSALLGEPRAIAELDYRSIQSPHLRGEARWRIEDPATVHGAGLWFDTTLASGVGFSNAPDQPRAIYGQAFFPFARPLDLRSGDAVSLSVAANLVGEGYVWRWQTTVRDAGGKTRADLRQSSFQGTPVNPQRLRRKPKRRG